jgi:F-type H+-transporting ATPase subunit b
MEHQSAGVDIFAPDIIMSVLTWVTFLALLFVLKKFAWTPIIAGLDQREKDIRTSLDAADKARAQLADVEVAKSKILEEARTQGMTIIQDARKTAEDVGKEIETKAKAHAESIIFSANAQIAGEREQVMNQLKRESIDTAIALAEKVLEANLDKDKNRQLVERAIQKDMN